MHAGGGGALSEDELAPLRRRFCARTAGQVRELRASIARWDVQAPEIERVAHTIAGTGAMLGFREVAAAAAAVDDRYAAGQLPSREALEALLTAMEALDPAD